MADIVFIVVVIIGFFALCAALVAGCDRIVRSGDDGLPAVTETTAEEIRS
jgi:hypothetical protein